MSLQQLSTELDTLICEHCDTSTLLSLCATSQYWRTLAEPILYQAVCFTVDEVREVKILLITLIERPDLAKYVRKIRIAPSWPATHPTGPSSSSQIYQDQGLLEWTAEGSVGDKDGANGLDDPDFLFAEEQKSARIENNFRALTPRMAQIIESAWPKVSGHTKKHLWIAGLNTSYYETADPYLPLIVTLTTNVEELDLQYPRDGSANFTNMILHYHRTAHEVACGNPYPFHKLRDLQIQGTFHSQDSGHTMSLWAPLPVSTESLVIRDYEIDHFEYAQPREVSELPSTKSAGSSVGVIPKAIRAGFGSKLRILDMRRCYIAVPDLVCSLRNENFCNLETLRITKLSHAHRWLNMPWALFGGVLRSCLPKLQELELSMWWDQPGQPSALSGPVASVQTIRGLQTLPNLRILNINLGLLMYSFAGDAANELLTLPCTVVPEDLEYLELTDVPLQFLDEIVHENAATKRRNVLAQLLLALPHCHWLLLQTYRMPSAEVLNGLQAIRNSLAEMNVEFKVSCCCPPDEAAHVDGEKLVLI
ncbi:hypothetical protein HBI71_064900 [Parastagonospora nodorum]|nr:hypothetical protein HBI71_064900 [Parastagonospora nodorum]KAH5439887.1 hypothetical protein HBI47_046490 [Parastagonospora nodorum]